MYLKNKFHGVFSLALIDVAIVVCLYSITINSLLFSALYFVGTLISIFTIVGLFCSKCTSKNDCSHVYPAQLTRYFKNKCAQKYSINDYIGTGIAIGFVFLFPQYWLWKNTGLFVFFWALFLIAGLQINLKVCTTCKNTKCGMCKNKELLKHINLSSK